MYHKCLLLVSLGGFRLFYIEMHYVKSRFVQYANKNKAKKFELNNNENEWESEIESAKIVSSMTYMIT